MRRLTAIAIHGPQVVLDAAAYAAARAHFVLAISQSAFRLRSTPSEHDTHAPFDRLHDHLNDLVDRSHALRCSVSAFRSAFRGTEDRLK